MVTNTRIQNENNLFCDEQGATFSECAKYKFALWRIWENELPKIMFIGLNPSTATEKDNDHTGYGGFYMLNLFPFITPYPKELKECSSEALLKNDTIIEQYGKVSEQVFFAWGAFKAAKERAKVIQKMFPRAMALEINQDGTPKHPLYVAGNIKPVLFSEILIG